MRILHPAPIFQDRILGVIRIVLGILLIYHGQELFHPEIMQVYFSWDAFQGANGQFLAYVGKSAELLSGILLTLGLLTRVGALLCVGTMAFVTFIIGNGEVWYSDQHPFMFVMFGALYFFSGPGAWSLDTRFFSQPDP